MPNRFLIIRQIHPPICPVCRIYLSAGDKTIGRCSDGHALGDTQTPHDILKVGVLESMQIGDILELEQILNRSTVARFHVTIEEE